jgi:hypothetical protein
VSRMQWEDERTDQDSLVVALLARLADLHRALGAGHYPPLRPALHRAQVYQVSTDPCISPSHSLITSFFPLIFSPHLPLVELSGVADTPRPRNRAIAEQKVADALAAEALSAGKSESPKDQTQASVAPVLSRV